MQDNALFALPAVTPQPRTCGVPGCGTRINIDNRIGFCRDHRQVTSRTPARFCGRDGCERKLQARNQTGFCSDHYGHSPEAIARRTAEAESRKSGWRVCPAEGCTQRLQPRNKSGRCYKHHWAPVSPDDRTRCAVEGCDRTLSPKNTLGRCIEHTLPRWVAAECAAEGCTKKLNVTNLNGFCVKHAPPYCRDTILRSKYGITEAEYDAMLAAQGGACALCGKPPKIGGKGSASRLHVDHCHETGRVRALLCNACNLGLGKFCDNPALLRAAADYIEHYARHAAA